MPPSLHKTKIMKYHISTSININADVKTVWKTFTQFDQYPEWNSFIKSIKGNVAVGEKINIEIDGMKFSPRVLAFDQEKELTWLGSASLKGIFDGRHSFKFQENANGTTDFLHEEHFRGILVPFMKKKLQTEIVDGFKRWNETLKEKSEQQV